VTCLPARPPIRSLLFAGDPRCRGLSRLRGLPHVTRRPRPARRPHAGRAFGRRIAILRGYDFSDALRRLDIVWTPETDARLFELGPIAYTPGTKMSEQRIGAAEDRAALVRFLQKATAP